MEEKRKKSLLRYIAIMFVVAFVLVLVSLVGQTRSIGQLSESSASALQRAEELQTTNRELTDRMEALEEENKVLTGQLEELKKEQTALEQQLDTAEEDAAAREEQVRRAYENLLKGDPDDIHEEYLGPKGLETYENLTKEGN